MIFSNRVYAISSSLTSETRSIAKKMAQQGKKILNLSAGELNVEIPAQIKVGIQNALKEETNLYTDAAGLLKLREEVSCYFNNFFDYNSISENIILTNGAKHGLFNVALVLLNEGDEVIIGNPLWGTFAEQVKLVGAKPISVDISNSGYQLTPKLVADNITGKTKLVIINTPSNPAGKCISFSDLREILELAKSNNFYIVLDLSYHRYIFDSTNTKFSVADYFNNVIVVDSFSKSLALTGWRFGYVAANKNIIDKIRSVQSHTTSNVSSLIQHGMLGNINENMDTFIKSNLQHLKANKDEALKILMRQNCLIPIIPDGGFYIYCRINFELINLKLKSKYSTSSDFCKDLLLNLGVSVTPGEAFGDHNGLRISLCGEKIDLCEGLSAINDFLGVYSLDE